MGNTIKETRLGSASSVSDWEGNPSYKAKGSESNAFLVYFRLSINKKFKITVSES